MHKEIEKHYNKAVGILKTPVSDRKYLRRAERDYVADTLTLLHSCINDKQINDLQESEKELNKEAGYSQSVIQNMNDVPDKISEVIVIRTWTVLTTAGALGEPAIFFDSEEEKDKNEIRLRWCRVFCTVTTDEVIFDIWEHINEHKITEIFDLSKEEECDKLKHFMSSNDSYFLEPWKCSKCDISELFN
eukprot:gb/GECH01012950.1/.p1 GENE.gb/GECH01012950.1/~~gb/GECH01012950.1/.p1  ORF type:complete len:189 (+),score=17.93 gb/GECH01012950.1/:1-567(+)